MKEKELFAKRRSSVRMMWQGRFQQLPFAYEPLDEETFRFYDLRSFHFEDSPEAFVDYLTRRGDTELAGRVTKFLAKYHLYLYWLRFSRTGRSYHKTKKIIRPTLQETRKVKKVISQAKSCRERALTSSEVRI